MAQRFLGLIIGIFVSFNVFANDYHFDGIVGLSNCSGSIIRFTNSKPNDPAVVLTNGHCLESGMPPANTFHYREKSNRKFEVLNDQGRKVGTVTAVGVLYSTMTLTDITLYQLKETYQNIFDAFKVHAFLLSPNHPVAATPIEIISGYWRQGYSCSIDGFVFELREGDWAWSDSIRYSRPGCEIVGGTSGSPVVNASTREVLGVSNTINDKGGHCTLEDPCEVDRSGNITSIPGNGYAQETYLIYTCLNPANQFNLSTPGCKLFH